MPALTSANVAEAIPKLIAARVLAGLEPQFVMARLVNRDYENVLADYGDTVNVPIPPTLVANNIIESGNVQPQNPDMGNAQIILDSHVEATVQIPDVTKALAQPDLLSIYTDRAITAIATRVESDLFATYPLFTSNAAVGGATAMDESRIDSAETALFNAYVPQNQPLNLVVSGTAYGQTRQIPRFTEFQTGVAQGQASPMQTGQLAGGRVKNFNVYRSQLVPNVGGTTYNLAFARDAMALVVRPLALPLPGTGAIGAYMEKGGFGVRVIVSYQHGMLGTMFTVDCLYGCGPLRQSFAVLVESN